MGWLSWIVLGGLAGWLASMFVESKHRQGCVVNIIAGIVGAVIGGALFSLIGGRGVTGFNLHSLIVSFVGAVVFLLLLNALDGGSKRRRRRK